MKITPPDWRDVLMALADLRDHLPLMHLEETQVRLRIPPSFIPHTWELLSGSPQYDQDHRGYWGHSYLSVSDDLRQMEAAARLMVDEALAAAMEEEAFS